MQQWTRRRDLWTKSFVNPACNIQVPAAPCFWHGHLLVKKGTCIRLCLSQWDSNCSFVANHVHAWNRGTLFTISHLSLWPKHFKAWAYLSISQCGLFYEIPSIAWEWGLGHPVTTKTFLAKIQTHRLHSTLASTLQHSASTRFISTPEVTFTNCHTHQPHLEGWLTPASKYRQTCQELSWIDRTWPYIDAVLLFSLVTLTMFTIQSALFVALSSDFNRPVAHVKSVLNAGHKL